MLSVARRRALNTDNVSGFEAPPALALDRAATRTAQRAESEVTGADMLAAVYQSYDCGPVVGWARATTPGPFSTTHTRQARVICTSLAQQKTTPPLRFA